MRDWNSIQQTLKTHIVEFNRIHKCLNKQQLPGDETVREHVTNIIAVYNKILSLYGTYKHILTSEHKESFGNDCLSVRDKLHILFDRLQLNILIPSNITDQVDKDIPNPNFKGDSENNSDNDNDTDDTTEMTQTAIDFMALAGRTITKNYDGNYLGLSAFINSIDLLDALTLDANKNLLRRFIVSINLKETR